MLTKEEAIEIAKQVFDPEIPVSIWDLGLIYDIQINSADESIDVRMTLTSEKCPAAQSLPQTLRTRLLASGKVKEVEVEIVFEPLWTPQRISEEGRRKMGIGQDGPAL